jgi:hypothetical protein
MTWPLVVMPSMKRRCGNTNTSTIMVAAASSSRPSVEYWPVGLWKRTKRVQRRERRDALMFDGADGGRVTL